MSLFGTGFGQNNQQQQQQQPNAFGQTNSFGGTGFGAFGQNAQQQQPQQTNPMFGNLASSASTPSTGFGASRSSQPPATTTLSIPTNVTGAFGSSSSTSNLFGQPKPAFGSSTGPGAFGSTSTGAGAFGTAGTGSTFGASGSGGGLFGQPAGQQQQQGTFGGVGGLFGQPQTSGFGATPLSTTTVPTTGTSSPPFQEFQERDSNGTVASTLHYQSISCMAAYRNASFEELRVQDYQQGRKTANSFGSTSSAFSQPAQQQQSGTNLFGQPSTSTGFGQQQPAQPTTTGLGAYGQPQSQQTTAFGAVGQLQQPQQQQPSTGFNAFGQPPQSQTQATTGFGAFGQQQPQQASTGFGAFGQQAQQNKGFGAFGQPQSNPSPFSAFGSTPATTSSPFAQPPQNQSLFGAFGQQNNQVNQQGGNSFPKPSAFGQPTTGGGLFGNTGQQQQGGLFGNTGQQQQPQGGGLFGQQSSGTNAYGQPAQQQPQQQTGLFGQPGAGGGLFSNTNQQQQNQQPAPGGGFGSLFPNPPGGGLFGSTSTTQNQQQNPNPANPLFGGGGGLFGNNNTQQQQPSTTNPLFGGNNSGSLFGGKPPAPAPGFGASAGGGGLFGNTQQQTQQQPPSLGGGLFGATNAQTQQGPQLQLSLFGGSAQPQPPQPNLTAAIDQPLPSLPLPSLPPLPPLASSLSPKKKSNVFADVAVRSSPRLGLGVGLNYTPPGPGSKLRGFTTNASTATVTRNPFMAPLSGSPGKGGLVFAESKSLLSPDAFSSGSGGSLQLLGGARQSVKKLVLEKRVDGEDLHRLRAQGGGGTSSTRRDVRCSSALSVAAREKDHSSRRSASPAKTPPPARSASRPDAPSASPAEYLTASSPPSKPLDPREGEYWCLPTVADLQSMSFAELQSVKDFTVGRVGFGTVHFLQPVDVTTVPSIADIPGKIITLEHIECTVYADERLKPPAGEGLNVPARIKLDRCWALDKSTREPIKDPKDIKYQQRLRKMQGQECAEFIGFDAETGVWEFIVQEF